MEAATNGQPDAAGQRDLVVVGASAGGVDALQALAASLPPDFPAAVLVVLHVPSTGTSVLPQILTRKGRLPAEFARDGAELERGHIYVAPADHHMLVQDGHISLTQGPRENGHRPAIDPLFRSAARVAGPRCIGVVMSGLLDDGATGLRFIKDHGGAVVVQDPLDASFPSMPKAALEVTGGVDAVVGAADLGAALCALIDDPLREQPRDGNELPADRDVDGKDRVAIEDPNETRALVEGPPSALTCPECGGALWEQEDGETVRYACHVGHAFSLASLFEEQGRTLEMTLWSAVRALEERADLHRRLARRTGDKKGDGAYERRAEDAQENARTLRAILAETGRLAAPAPEQG